MSVVAVALSLAACGPREERHALGTIDALERKTLHGLVATIRPLGGVAPVVMLVTELGLERRMEAAHRHGVIVEARCTVGPDGWCYLHHLAGRGVASGERGRQ